MLKEFGEDCFLHGKFWVQLSCNPNLEELENFVCVEGWGVWSPINTKMSVSFLNGGNYHQTIKSLEAEGSQMSHYVEQQQETPFTFSPRTRWPRGLCSIQPAWGYLLTLLKLFITPLFFPTPHPAPQHSCKQILFRMNWVFLLLSLWLLVKPFLSGSGTERREYWSKIKNLSSVVSCVAFDTFLPLSGRHFSPF